MTDIIRVQGYPIRVDKDGNICLTDMAKVDGDDSRAADVIKNWIRNRGTIEFLGTWEAIYNPNFKVVEFDHFRKSAGLPTFVLSVANWVEKTDAIGIYTKLGKTGGTYANKDIAFEFGSAISPAFKLYLIKEYQRLKEQENNAGNLEWNVRRVLSKAHYHVQTDAIKEYKIPIQQIPADRHWIAYAEEGDVLNIAVFGFTAKQWREANPELAAKHNVRDFASINELAVISSIEGINAEMIKSNQPLKYRLDRLREIAQQQLKSLERVDMQKSFKRTVEGDFKPFIKSQDNPKGIFPEQQKEPLSDFNQKLTKALNFNPKEEKDE